MKTKLSSVNKRILILILTTFVILVGFFIFHKITNDCAGCESCDYKAFSKTVYISNFVTDENDELILVYFSTKGNHSNNSMWIGKLEITTSKLDTLKLSQLKNKNIYYRITGKGIIKGACQPYIIEKISSLK